LADPRGRAALASASHLGNWARTIPANRPHTSAIFRPFQRLETRAAFSTRDWKKTAAGKQLSAVSFPRLGKKHPKFSKAWKAEAMPVMGPSEARERMFALTVIPEPISVALVLLLGGAGGLKLNLGDQGQALADASLNSAVLWPSLKAV
jgi:hypothetical protein